jgi:ankyrin repeat protein
MSLLHKAAQLGDVPLTQLLLDCGADVEAADVRRGDTPMHYAAWTGPAAGRVVCSFE